MARLFTLMILIVLLAGCAPGSVVKNTADPASAADEVVMVVTTSGGIAGQTNTWTVYASGKVTDGEGVSLTASPKSVTALRSELINAGFATQAKDMPRVKVCPDCTQTDVTLTIDGKPVTLSIVNEASDTPASARSLVEKVTAFIAQQNNQ